MADFCEELGEDLDEAAWVVALDGVAGTLCAAYDRAAWQAALAPHVQASDPRIAGRDRAALWSARQMARRVLDAWGEVLRLPVEAPNSGAVSA